MDWSSNYGHLDILSINVLIRAWLIIELSLIYCVQSILRTSSCLNKERSQKFKPQFHNVHSMSSNNEFCTFLILNTLTLNLIFDPSTHMSVDHSPSQSISAWRHKKRCWNKLDEEIFERRRRGSIDRVESWWQEASEGMRWRKLSRDMRRWARKVEGMFVLGMRWLKLLISRC